MSEPQNDRERFELDLPFYVNGTLDADRRTWMDARLAEHPAWAPDVEWARVTRDAVRHARSKASVDVRWKGLQARLLEEGVLPAATAPIPAPARDPPRRGRWASTLLFPLAVPWPALALAVAVVAVQGYLLAHRGAGGGEGAVRYRSASAPQEPCAQAAWLQVAVSPKVPIGEWSVALRTLGLSVAAGPDKGGEWSLRVPAGEDPEAKRQALRAVAGIEAVTVRASPPGKCP